MGAGIQVLTTASWAVEMIIPLSRTFVEDVSRPRCGFSHEDPLTMIIYHQLPLIPLPSLSL